MRETAHLANRPDKKMQIRRSNSSDTMERRSSSSDGSWSNTSGTRWSDDGRMPWPEQTETEKGVFIVCQQRRKRQTDVLRWRNFLIVAAAVLVVAVPVLDAAAPKLKKEGDSYTIGGVLSGYESEKHFRETIEVNPEEF